MYQQFNRYKILQVFFDNPNKKYQLRELSRITKISLPSVKKHVQELLKQGLLKETIGEIYNGYTSSFSSTYKILKRNDLLIRLEESGLIKELDKIFTPNCIVLYGSAVEGADDERGDIDIFVQASKKNFNLEQYENLLNRKISLLFESDMEKIDSTLKNSILNGIVLKGFLKVI
jgi:predicted nucleotidyltransferase